MMSSNPIPAAQYLRMSTEHQQYSIENQSAAILRYADSHGFEIVYTYSDAARRGLVLKTRPELRQLLGDVVGGQKTYKAILVYDVSRWGRFQDTDEAAHYEFLCKSAGVPVHYCAETFSNDGSLPSSIMKTLKRTMAGEFSRELSVKVFNGQKRLAELGFKQGGMPGYGLRRMLVSPDRAHKQLLEHGQRKSIATDRVILVPGPADEVLVVRDIYGMLLGGMAVYGIARCLNRKRIPYVNGAQWDYTAVFHVLTHPKYKGSHVFGRTSQTLCTRTIRKPRSEWTITPNAFEALIDAETFEKAQAKLESRTFGKSNQEVLADLKALLRKKGRLSFHMITKARGVAKPTTLRHRFGSLRKVYELIGYGKPTDFGPIDIRRRTQALRDDLMARIQATFPEDVSIVRRGNRWRPRLRLRNGRVVSVVLGTATGCQSETHWAIHPVKAERRYMTLLALLQVGNEEIKELFVIPKMDHRNRFLIRGGNDPWLEKAIPVSNLLSLPSCIADCSRRA